MEVDLGAVAQIARHAAERDQANPEQYPEATIAELFADGVLRAPFPKALGGSGWTPVDAARAIEVLAAGSPSAALIAAMPLGLAGVYGGSGDAVPAQHRAAWRSQTERLAADYMAGQLYAACNSEAGAGGSLAATKTEARGADGTWRITGTKILASSGPHADVFFSTAKVSQEDLPGAGIVEFFYVPTRGEGVHIGADWDGFGMRASESQTVSYSNAPASALCGFPNFLEIVQPVSCWYCLFAAIPLGCASGMLSLLSVPAPDSPAMRLRLAEARMRYEAMSAYLYETAAAWKPAAGPGYAARVLRMKTYVTSEATKLCAELFALSGGRQYRRGGLAARLLADSFAGTALRPPLSLSLDLLVSGFDAE